MNPFQNPQIEVEALPKADELHFQALENSYLNVQLIGNTIFWLILGFIGGNFFLSEFSNIPRVLQIVIPSVIGFFLLISFLSIFFGFKHKSFAIRAHDIQYKTGWLWRKMIVVPFRRIQHSEVSQGPIERRFNLGKLKVFTAGGSASDLTIPGLTYQQAEKLKILITSKISSQQKSYGEEE